MKTNIIKHFPDTPGFENENQTKPEETKIISGGGGLTKPEDMADKILTDSLVKRLVLCNRVEMEL